MQLTVLLSEKFRRIYDWMELFPFPPHTKMMFLQLIVSQLRFQ